MIGRPKFSRATTAILLALMLPQLTGCAGYTPVPTPEPELRAAEPKTVYRLWIGPHRTETVRAVTLVGDSLRGIRIEPRRDSIITVHRQDVRVVERVGTDAAGSAVGGLFLVVALAAIVISAADPCVAAFC